MKVAEEMIYTGGNSWVLERIELIDSKIVYFRLSDTTFVKSKWSLEDVQSDVYSYEEIYWNVGADNNNNPYSDDEVSQSLTKLMQDGWYPIFAEMLKVYRLNKCDNLTDYIKSVVLDSFDDTLAEIYRHCNVETGDISPDQSGQWHKLASEVVALFKELVEANK